MSELATKAASKEQIEAAYAAILDGKELKSYADPELVSRAIVERIMSADTFEEAFQAQDVPAWRDYLDVPMRVHRFHLNPSSFEGSSSVYAVVDVERLDGKDPAGVFTVTCGGRNVLAQLVKALEKGWLAKPVSLIAKRTREGYDALWLQDASNPIE
jgi:hypothetical protein